MLKLQGWKTKAKSILSFQASLFVSLRSYKSHRCNDSIALMRWMLECHSRSNFRTRPFHRHPDPMVNLSKYNLFCLLFYHHLCINNPLFRILGHKGWRQRMIKDFENLWSMKLYKSIQRSQQVRKCIAFVSILKELSSELQPMSVLTAKSWKKKHSYIESRLILDLLYSHFDPPNPNHNKESTSIRLTRKAVGDRISIQEQ